MEDYGWALIVDDIKICPYFLFVQYLGFLYKRVNILAYIVIIDQLTLSKSVIVKYICLV